MRFALTGPPRRRPYPYDAVIAGTGVMLARPERGAPLVAIKPATLDQVAPTAYEYGAQSPLVERIHEWEDLTLGYGLDIQESFRDRKYRYTLGADLSIGGFWQKGPDITTITPPITGAISHFFEIGGSLYALAGRYALKRTGDLAADWAVSRDFGVGKTALDVVVFFTNAGGGANYAYVAMGDGTGDFIWRFDGTTWTQHASLQALRFIHAGRELYRAHDINNLAKVNTNADPWTAANWTAANAFRVGERNSSITGLALSAAGTLVIFKTDGVYTLDGAGQDEPKFPFLSFAPDGENGKWHGVFGNHLHTTYREGHFRLDPALTYEPIGPERIMENRSEVKGRVTAFLGHNTFHAYAGLYDVENNRSYLLKFGGFITPSVADGKLEEAKANDAWHGSISPRFTGKKLTALGKSTIGAAANHTRLYIGFGNGDVAWFPLPCTPNPANCTEYRYTTADGEVYLPLWHGLFLADTKTLRSVTMAGPKLDANNYAQFEYKTDPSAASYTALGTNFDTTPREKADFPDNTSSFLTDVRVLLKSTVNTASPQLGGVALHHALRPALILAYQFGVRIGHGLVARDGTPLIMSAAKLRTAIKDAADAQGSVTVYLPDESSQQLSFVDYGEQLDWVERHLGWHGVSLARAVQFKTNTVYGTIDRLGAYTIDDLGGYSIDQLGFL